jgi:hypothetical protein
MEGGLFAVIAGALTQNIENNPMQSRMGSGSPHSRGGMKWSVVTAQPDLIPH